MNKFIIVCLLALSFSSTHSAVVTNQSIQAPANSEYASIIIDSLWEQAGHANKIIAPPTIDIPPTVDVTPTKKEEEKQQPDVKNKPQKVEPIKPIEPVSPGKLKIEKIKGLKGSTSGKIDLGKKENPLDKYRNKKSEEIKPSGKGSDIIAQQIAENRAKLKARMDELKRADEEKRMNAETGKEESLLDLRNKSMAGLKQKQQQTLVAWKSKIQKTYQRWAQAREEYIKRIPEYEESTFEFAESGNVGFVQEELKKPMSKAIRNDFHVIPGALDIPVRDQGRRPTCAAFTGVRAIETLINAKGKQLNLSEQYFYWSSKPECQQFPCSQRGSWITSGFDKSSRSVGPDIPLDKDCPYIMTSVNGNETQIPLESGCRRGVAQVLKYAQYYSLNDVYNALSNNSPIIAGFKLSPNFYKTKGLVTYKESREKGAMDGHASGHAVLLIGHMKLPEKLHATEGKFCFVVANSWSEGWGRGGFGCLTERWVKEYKVRNPFIALTKVSYEE